MQLLRKSRWLLLALLLSLVPASSFAGVLISVSVGPPVLPVYEQPPCPEPGWMWTPGYWAYGDDGYYWVPGSWVPAPYEGALWTPPYWGWSGGLYVFHPGYWGRHVGYYGGINYGFGYMGIGFVGGRWHGRDFEYNTAVMRVNNVHIHNTYIDRRVVEHNTIVNERHVGYSGGPGGIRHDPGREERMAMNEHHMGASQVQMQHMQAARSDRTFYAKNNGGRPQNVVAERPMGYGNHGQQGNGRPQQPNSFNNNRGGNNGQSRPQFQPEQRRPDQRGLEQQRQPQYQQQQRQPQYQQQQRQPQYQQQQRQPQYQPQQRGSEQQPRGNAQQPHGNNQQPRNESRPAPQEHGGNGGGHPQHEEKPRR